MHSYVSSVDPELNSPGSVTVREGNTITLNLEGDGNDRFLPIINFRWTFNGEVLYSGERISLGIYNISITNVRRTDGGVYQVTVETDAGRASSNFTLDVQCELTNT